VEKIETKKHKVVNEKTLIVAVDIGKVVNTGYCRCPNGTEVKPFAFSNNRHGFQEFFERISETKERHHLDDLVVGFESTGSYGEPLMHDLLKRSVRIVQINPLHTKRLKEVRGNSPGKTDRKDPKVIADIIALGHALTVVIPEGVSAELRRLTQGRERGIQRRTALFNQLHALAFLLFPEFLQVMKDIKRRSTQYLLRHYPTPEAIVNCGLETLTVILRRISRGRLGRERAKALYEAATQSVGIREGQQAIVMEIREILSSIEASDRFMRAVEEEMSRYLKEVPYSHSILSLKGIGEVTAAGLIGEVGDFRKFQTLSEVIKLAGLDLFEISSGIQKGNRHISKRGRPLLRKLLFFAALNTARKGGIMHGLYMRYLQRGMPKIKALVAIARKILGIIFALVRDHSEYRENYSSRHAIAA